MTDKELQMLASLITGKGMKKEASAEKTAEDTAKLNAYYGNLMQQGAFGQKKAAHSSRRFQTCRNIVLSVFLPYSSHSGTDDPILPGSVRPPRAW